MKQISYISKEAYNLQEQREAVSFQLLKFLVLSDKPHEIAALEGLARCTQAQLVNEWIEEKPRHRFYHNSKLEPFYGHKGTPQTRLKALRAAIVGAEAARERELRLYQGAYGLASQAKAATERLRAFFNQYKGDTELKINGHLQNIEAADENLGELMRFVCSYLYEQGGR